MLLKTSRVLLIIQVKLTETSGNFNAFNDSTTVRYIAVEKPRRGANSDEVKKEGKGAAGVSWKGEEAYSVKDRMRSDHEGMPSDPKRNIALDQN